MYACLVRLVSVRFIAPYICSSVCFKLEVVFYVALVYFISLACLLEAVFNNCFVQMESRARVANPQGPLFASRECTNLSNGEPSTNLELCTTPKAQR